MAGVDGSDCGIIIDLGGTWYTTITLVSVAGAALGRVSRVVAYCATLKIARYEHPSGAPVDEQISY